MSNPLVSVIVPVYNVEKYLKKCVESIMNQTFKNIEIILVDDGSTDASGKMCDYFQLMDNRIVVIHKENGGLSSARNAGIKRAKGIFVGFVDSDDWISETMYENLLSLTNKYDADVSECRFINVNKKTDLKKVIEQPESVLTFNHDDALRLHFQNALFYSVVWNKLYKKELFNGIEFPEGKIHEDEFTTYKILDKASKLVSTSNILYCYFRRSNSIMGQKFSSKSLDRLEAYKEKKQYFMNTEFEEMSQKQFIHEGIRAYCLAKNKINTNRLWSELIREIKLYSRRYSKRYLNYLLFTTAPTLYRYMFKLLRKTKHIIG
ncbi:glycosyltransferase [Sporolactobacillus sp. THM7-4]|nr:glycosyltransferase [Sporolactobacillus sp. THM7-4]